MELIKELGVKGSGVARKSWGTFKCPSCNVLIEKPRRDGLRNKSCGDKECRRNMFTPNTACKGNTKSSPNYKLVYYSSIKERYRLLKKEFEFCDTWSTLQHFIDDMYKEYEEARKRSRYLAFKVTGNVADKTNSSWVPVGKYLKYEKLSVDKPCYLYVINVLQYYKIGVTKRLSERMKTFNTANPHTVSIITAVPLKDAASIESELHTKYSEVNVKGEWFNLSGEQVKDVIEYLDKL